MAEIFDAEEIEAGQAVYSKKILLIYDLYVLGFSNRFIWHNPTPALVRLFNDNICARHLDVGVGSGYFLDKCQFPVRFPDIALLDLNNNSLAATQNRIRRYQPRCYQANLLEPLDIPEKPFSSISVNYLFHCIPGSIREKAVVFDYLRPYLQEDGVIFGSTLLQHGVKPSYLARKLMVFYNEKGIFHNQRDSLDDLEQALKNRFSRYELKVKGCAAIFKAWK